MYPPNLIRSVVKFAPEFFALLQNVGVDGLLVDPHQFPVLHQKTAVADGGLALPAGHAKEHVPVDVLVREGGEGLVVHDDHVRRRAGLQHAQGGEAGALRHFGVVAEEHVRHLAPAHVGHAGVVPLGAQGHLDRLQHVVGVGVGAHADENALLVELQHRGDAHGVAHVGLRVVDAHGVRCLDDVHLRRVHVDAVAQNGLGTQDAVVLEPLDRPPAVVLEGVVHVVHALGHVDVVAHPAVVGLHHPVKGPVGDGEQGVAAEHGLQHVAGVALAVVDEVLVLLNGLEGLFLAVPVADLVTQAGPHAVLLRHLSDLHQGAGDLAEAGVVVEDGGDALLDGVDHQGLGAGPRGLQVQVPVDVPPLAVQHLVEAGGVIPIDGEAPGQGGVDVGVGVDETRHDDAAPGVHELRLGVSGLQVGGGAHLHDLSPVSDHTAVGEIAHALAVPGDDLAVCQ